jgi:tetratricopeptide (TPR) repeat protein
MPAEYPDDQTSTKSRVTAKLNPERSALPNTEFIERCQIEYDRNPGSRVFAPLCEAYRRMGLIAEALELASRGVRLHPDFAAGRIAFARILIEKKAYPDALEQLTLASELSPDNILAFQLLGDTYLELRRPKEALKAFKMVLFLNPLHDRARKMVRKWEFLSAEEFEDESFEWTPDESQPLPEVDPEMQRQIQLDPSRADREAYRAISIADALTVRNDLEGAFAVLGRSLRTLGARPDLEQRLHLLGKRLGLQAEEVQRLAKETALAAQVELSKADKKKAKLEGILKRLRPR